MSTELPINSQKPSGSKTAMMFAGAIIAFFCAHYLYDIAKETLGTIRTNSSEIVAIRERISALEKSATKPVQSFPPPIGESGLRLPSEGPLPTAAIANGHQASMTPKKLAASGDLDIKTVSLLSEKKTTQEGIPEAGHFVLMGEEKNSPILKTVVTNPAQDSVVKLSEKK